MDIELFSPGSPLLRSNSKWSVSLMVPLQVVTINSFGSTFIVSPLAGRDLGSPSLGQYWLSLGLVS